jgi:hypothetical protein
MRFLASALLTTFIFTQTLNCQTQKPIKSVRINQDSCLLISTLFNNYRIDSLISNDDTIINIFNAYRIPFDTLIKQPNLQTIISKRPDYLLIKIDQCHAISLIIYDNRILKKDKGFINNVTNYRGVFNCREKATFDEAYLDSIITILNKLMAFNLETNEIWTPNFCDNYIISTGSCTQIKMTFKYKSQNDSALNQITFDLTCPIGPHTKLYFLLKNSINRSAYLLHDRQIIDELAEMIGYINYPEKIKPIEIILDNKLLLPTRGIVNKGVCSFRM